jgi:hypothetical protein
MFQPGTHVARHRILRFLAEGSVAEVYEVLAADGHRRALKIIKEGVPLTSSLQARLAQEAEAIAMIEHVNVVRFHDAGVSEGRAWVLLELVEGPTLRAFAQRLGGAVPIERALRLLRQAAEGVAAAHAAGIVHRDLRPENILVAEGDVAKVADFGAAKLDGWGVHTTSTLAAGSSLYMAPDYMLTKIARPESDVYSLGIVAHELLGGQHPIANEPLSAMDVCRRQLTFTPAPLSQLRRDVPGDVSAWVEQALRKDPARRPSMRQLAEGLATAQQHVLVSRRAQARAMALPGRELGLARTEMSMATFVEVAEHMKREAFEMRAVGYASSGEEAAAEERSFEERSAVLPPMPSGEQGSRPAWYDEVSERRAGGGHRPEHAAETLRSAVARVSAVDRGSRESGGSRGSTNAPVASGVSAQRSGRAPRGSAVVALGALVLLAALSVVGWVVMGSAGGSRSAAVGGGVGPVAASASAVVGAASASAAGNAKKSEGLPGPRRLAK